MSLFKILKGDSARVGVDVTPFHDGYAYFTPDDGGFYIDSEDDGVQRRIRINPDEVEMSQVTGLDTALEAKADEADLTAHTGNTNNPHSVTAAQVGARPNTWTPSATDVGADPAGTATSAVNTHNQAQNAHSALFSAKANASDLTAHVDNTSNPHGVTAAQVGARPDTWVPTAGDVGADPSGTAASAVAAHDESADAHSGLFAGKANESDLTAHVENTSNPHSVTAAQVGAATTGALESHTGNTSNPHGVTAAQVGARPDDWTPTAADVGADPAGTATSAVNTHNQAQNAHSALFSAKANASDLTAHVDNTSNPHGVTAAQVGAATIGALESHTGNTANPHSVTAVQVGARPDDWTPTAADVGAATTALYTATLTAAGWTGSAAPYVQTMTVTGLLDSDTPFVDITQTGTEETDSAVRSAWGVVTRMVATTDMLTAYASAIPEINIPIQVKVVK